MKKVRVVLWSMVVIATTVVGGVWVAGGFLSKLPSSRTVSTADFVADFELTDYKGMVQTDEDFRGQWMLVFFGFTNCPDVCPMGLSTIAQVLDDLGATGQALQPVFITVDPARDTPAVLAQYVPQFDTRIIGLSGSAEQIERTLKSIISATRTRPRLMAIPWAIHRLSCYSTLMASLFAFTSITKSRQKLCRTYKKG